MTTTFRLSFEDFSQVALPGMTVGAPEERKRYGSASGPFRRKNTALYRSNIRVYIHTRIDIHPYLLWYRYHNDQETGQIISCMAGFNVYSVDWSPCQVDIQVALQKLHLAKRHLTDRHQSQDVTSHKTSPVTKRHKKSPKNVTRTQRHQSSASNVWVTSHNSSTSHNITKL